MKSDGQVNTKRSKSSYNYTSMTSTSKKDKMTGELELYYDRRQVITCKLLLIASSQRYELFTRLERFFVSCPSSSPSKERKLCRPTTYFKNASPSTSNLSREKRSMHLSVVSASKI